MIEWIELLTFDSFLADIIQITMKSKLELFLFWNPRDVCPAIPGLEILFMILTMASKL